MNKIILSKSAIDRCSSNLKLIKLNFTNLFFFNYNMKYMFIFWNNQTAGYFYLGIITAVFIKKKN